MALKTKKRFENKDKLSTWIVHFNIIKISVISALPKEVSQGSVAKQMNQNGYGYKLQFISIKDTI